MDITSTGAVWLEEDESAYRIDGEQFARDGFVRIPRERMPHVCVGDTPAFAYHGFIRLWCTEVTDDECIFGERV